MLTHLDLLAQSNALFEAYGFQANNVAPDLKAIQDVLKDKDPNDFRNFITKEISNSSALRYSLDQADRGVLAEITKDRHRELAHTQAEYFSALSFKVFDKSITEFQRSMLQVLTSEMHQPGHVDFLGVIAMIPRIYSENIKRDKWRSRQAELQDQSEFVGEIGGYLSDLAVKVEYVKQISPDKKSRSWLFQCTHGNNFVKFFINESDSDTDSDVMQYVSPGDQIHISGKVWKHQDNAFLKAKCTQLVGVRTL